MKVTEAEYEKNQKTASKIDLSDALEGLNKSQQREVLDQVGELLVTQILEYVADSKSPVTGKLFDPLSKEYAEKKKNETGSEAPNLDLTGEMLSSLDYKIINQGIEIGVYGDDAGKADGHNNFSGESLLPERRFLPKKGQLFDEQIVDVINEAIELYKAENMELDENILKSINSTDRLYDYLKSEYGDMSRSKIKDLVLSTEAAVLLDELDLLDLL